MRVSFTALRTSVTTLHSAPQRHRFALCALASPVTAVRVFEDSLAALPACKTYAAGGRGIEAGTEPTTGVTPSSSTQIQDSVTEAGSDTTGSRRRYAMICEMAP